MTRPGFVIDVDTRTPALLGASGQRFWLQRMPEGTQVVYPAEATASSDPSRLIESAISAPISGEALVERLRPETKLTIAVLDDGRPYPRARFDVRRAIVERLLELAARRCVDDVMIVVGSGLKKRWSAYDVTRTLGDRVASSFQPDGMIISHDITSALLVPVGTVQGHEVQLNARVAESDLVIVVGVQSDNSNGSPIVRSLVDVETLRRIGPGSSDDFRAGVAATVHGATDFFAIQAVLGQPSLLHGLEFAAKREWEWNLADKLRYVGLRQIEALAPKLVRRRLAAPLADYAVLDVLGGTPDAVFAEARQVWAAANSVPVARQADVALITVWGGSFDEDLSGSPINAAEHALVDRLGHCSGRPYVRDGGVVVAFHPLRPVFSNRRQAAAGDFFARVLPRSIDPAEMLEAEQAASADPWYLDLYRRQFADHPLATFQSWYKVARAAGRLGDVIWVGADRRTADLFGHRAATALPDALEIASDKVGRDPQLTFLHGIGLALGQLS